MTINMLTEWENSQINGLATCIKLYVFDRFVSHIFVRLFAHRPHNKMFVQTSFHNQRGAENHEGKQNKANLHSTWTTVQPTAKRRQCFLMTTHIKSNNIMCSFVLHFQKSTTCPLNTTAASTRELNRGRWGWGVHMDLGLGNSGKKGQGQSVLGGLCGATVAHTALGPTCLLTDWCLVTVMVGMGELSAWLLTEPRIWTQEDTEAQGQTSLLLSSCTTWCKVCLLKWNQV